MADPVVLRVPRPYPDENAYLAAEAWSIDDKGMVLVDQQSLPKDTLVRFEIVLDDGSKPIRAEAKVHKLVPGDDDRPGGLKVRFRRFDAATKRFIDRVMEERRKERRSRRPPPAELAPLVLEPESPSSSETESAPQSVAPSAPEQSAPEVASEPIASAQESVPEEAPRPAALRASGSGPRVVPAPANREELLEKLRARRKK